MTLAKIIGTVVSSHKSRKLDGLKFLLLENIDASNMKGKNSYIVAMDSVGAGIGEIVFYVTGSSARLTDVTQGRATDATVIAIVDIIEKDGRYVYKKNDE